MKVVTIVQIEKADLEEALKLFAEKHNLEGTFLVIQNSDSEYVIKISDVQQKEGASVQKEEKMTKETSEPEAPKEEAAPTDTQEPPKETRNIFGQPLSVSSVLG